jgi:SEC-C motif
MLLSDWKEANLRTVAMEYPQFEAIEPLPTSGAILAWEGILQPFNGCQELGNLLDDLRVDHSVFVQAGALSHSPQCNRSHGPLSFLDDIGPEGAKFRVMVLAYAPERHPRAFARFPQISKLRFPDHRHINADGSICPYFATETELPWHGRTVATFLDYVSIWFAKHHVWEKTGANESAVWLGSQAPHTPSDVLKEVGRNDRCPCGSGKKFKQCHLAAYQQQRVEVPLNFFQRGGRPER